MLHISLEGLQKIVEQRVKVYTTCHKQKHGYTCKGALYVNILSQSIQPICLISNLFNHCVGKQIHTCKT